MKTQKNMRGEWKAAFPWHNSGKPESRVAMASSIAASDLRAWAGLDI